MHIAKASEVMGAQNKKTITCDIEFQILHSDMKYIFHFLPNKFNIFLKGSESQLIIYLSAQIPKKYSLRIKNNIKSSNHIVLFGSTNWNDIVL